MQPCRARVGGVGREEQRPETRGRPVGVLKWQTCKMHAERAARLSEHPFQLVRNGLVYTRGEKPRAIKSRNIMISQQLCLLTF